MATPQAPGNTPSAHPARRALPWLGRVAACWLAFGAAHGAQREYYFQGIGSERGLVQNTINALLQDRQGFVWVATQGGLHRYDGYAFRVYQHRPNDPGTLPDSFVTAVAEDDAGRLWVGTNTHYVAAFDPTVGRVVGKRVGAARGARHDRVSTMLYQPGKGLWVGTGAGVELLHPATGERRDVLSFDDNLGTPPSTGALALAQGALWAASYEGLHRIDPARLTSSKIAGVSEAYALLPEATGRLWIGGRGGLYRLEVDAAAPVRAWPPERGDEFSVRAIAMDGKGHLWLALWHQGLVRFDPATGEAEHIGYNPELPAGLPEQSLTTLMVDRSGLLWLGGEVRGLATTHPDGAPFEYLADLESSRNRIDTNNIRSLHQGTDGVLWLGTEGDGLKRYDLVTREFRSLTDTLLAAMPALTGSSEIRVLGIVDGDAGTLWVSTNRGLFRLDPTAGHATRVPVALGNAASADSDIYLRSMIRARDGSLWIGTLAAGLLHFSPATGEWQSWRHDPENAASLGHALVNSVFEDGRGRIWVGTLDGLNMLDPASGTMRRFRHDPADPASLSGDLVRAVHQSPDDTLWIGTHSGLNQVKETGDGKISFSHFGAEEGLPNPTVYGIAEDGQSRLWLSSNNGIASFDRATRRFRRYGLRDGLQDLEFNGGATLHLADGRIAFGGIRGFNLLDPQRLHDSTYAPPVVLTSVRAGNTELPLPSANNARLNVEQAARVLRLRFAALDFAAPEHNRFSYRLEPFDRDWIDAGTDPDTTYTNLDPGDYLFRVRATNHDGVWSQNALALPVRVIPTWWNSTPAHVVYVLLGLGLIGLLLLAQRARGAQERSLLLQIREREERLKLSLWGSGDEFWDWDVRANTLYRLGADQLLGMRTEHEMSTDDWRRRAVHPDDLPRVQQILQEHITGKTEFFESEHRIRNARSEWIWVRSRGKVVERDAQGNPLRIAGTARDITAGRRAERDRRIASEVLRSMGEAVAVTDLDFHFVSVNPAFSRITGYSEEEVAGQPSSLLNSPQHSEEFYRHLREAATQHGHWKGEMWQKRKDGEEFLGWIELSEVRDTLGARSHYVAVVNDVTDKKRAEQELRYLANYDTLTGLPNRSLLAERLARAVVRARRQETRVAVLFLDLDRFKDINDSLGHAAGDRILKAAAARLLGIVRESDTVARLGGDEFTVVVEDIGGSLTAESVAEKIIAAFGEPLEIDGRSEVTISPSIGISLYPDHGQVPTDLLKFADTAMYQAKDRGRNTYQIYTEAMDAEARRRATMVAALRRALERREFRLVYQPRLSLLDGRICGVEALLRWHCEELGEVPPTVFIPLAEETGLILAIGEWVLREACMTLQRWRRNGLLDVGISINVSVLQLLRGHLPDVIRLTLEEIDIPPERIELEVTESMVMANAEQTNIVLRELKRIGVSLAIDDFGTGYSSLIYLKRLPIDTLKIDKEFVGDLTNDPDDEAITATVITMAHSLGLNVVAEGVETEEQLMYLREQGCDEIQGFWLSPALDVHHCLAFIRNHRPQQRFMLGNAGTAASY